MSFLNVLKSGLIAQQVANSYDDVTLNYKKGKMLWPFESILSFNCTLVSTPECSTAIHWTSVASPLAVLAVCIVTVRNSRRASLDSQIDKLIEMGITHPFLESESFVSTWAQADSQCCKIVQYDNYCCYLFNLMERLWKFHLHCPKLIESHFNTREMIARHCIWWQKNEAVNSQGYKSTKFQRYVNHIIEEAKNAKEQSSDTN